MAVDLLDLAISSTKTRRDISHGRANAVSDSASPSTTTTRPGSFACGQSSRHSAAHKRKREGDVVAVKPVGPSATSSKRRRCEDAKSAEPRREGELPRKTTVTVGYQQPGLAGELPYHGREITPAMMANLLDERNPIEPILEVARSIGKNRQASNGGYRQRWVTKSPWYNLEMRRAARAHSPQVSSSPDQGDDGSPPENSPIYSADTAEWPTAVAASSATAPAATDAPPAENATAPDIPVVGPPSAAAFSTDRRHEVSNATDSPSSPPGSSDDREPPGQIPTFVVAAAVPPFLGQEQAPDRRRPDCFPESCGADEAGCSAYHYVPSPAPSDAPAGGVAAAPPRDDDGANPPVDDMPEMALFGPQHGILEPPHLPPPPPQVRDVDGENHPDLGIVGGIGGGSSSLDQSPYLWSLVEDMISGGGGGGLFWDPLALECDGTRLQGLGLDPPPPEVECGGGGDLDAAAPPTGQDLWAQGLPCDAAGWYTCMDGMDQADGSGSWGGYWGGF